jgi:mannosyltransferase OCH1-like enzyme
MQLSMGTDVKYRLRLVLNFIKNFNFIYFRIDNNISSVNSDQIIPNLIYQTTKSKWLPRKYHKDIKQFRVKNPDFSFITFDQKSMSAWMKLNFKNEMILNAYLASKFGVMQSDIFKYCYGYRNGGISLDISKYFSQPLNKIFDDLNHEMILSQQSDENDTEKIRSSEFFNLNLNNALLINWCFATSANNPALLGVIRIIENNFIETQGKVFSDTKLAIWENTGPIAFNRGLLNSFNAKLPKKVSISKIDFGENEWPKFQSSNLVNIFSKHYTEHINCTIFN